MRPAREKMFAAYFDRPGGPENLYMKEVVKPDPGEGEVLVRVFASALNKADLLQYKERLVRAFTEEALPHFSRWASPRLQPLVDSVYALQDIAKAHRAMEENRNIGKIIIEIPAFVKKGPRQ
ncbi:hypothetical protein HGM15179_003233 [Zosterops borbonicus]|uniref:Uncharacterized protein n=1 Tax=Zosterops borbonicus TaxID=364589 RepID=A0A8K1LS31_9PASS|nr:hypothetical protein HGM15179_003233 [Zosterops borbonicus]